MNKISLEQFICNTQGTYVDVPWTTDGHLKGECVSLIQQYISQCLGQPAKARGHAKTWQTSYVNEGLGTIATEPRKGDILVFPNEANGYGHLAIYIDSNTIYDQNNLSHDNKASGYGKLWTNDYIILRPNAELVEDVVVPEPQPVPAPEPVQPVIEPLKIGDRVKIIGTGNGSSLGTSNTAYGIGWERQILKIWEGRLYPYQVGDSTGTTGFYKAEALQRI